VGRRETEELRRVELAIRRRPWFYTIAFSSDGKTLAAGKEDHLVYL
jgi:hypothetical protein